MSLKEKHLKENLNAAGLKLLEEDMKILDKLID